MQINSVIRCKRKTVSVKISDDGGLIIRAPLHCPQKAIEQAVKDCEKWIVRRSAEIDRQNWLYKPVTGENGDGVFYFGKKLTLLLSQVKRITIDAENAKIYAPDKPPEEVKASLVKWFKEEAKVYLKERAILLCLREGLPLFQKLTVSSAKSKWGSCNAKGEIRLSYKLMFLPAAVTDYVIFHELCHIEHHNHGQAFWAKVEKVCPYFKLYKKYLKDNFKIIETL